VIELAPHPPTLLKSDVTIVFLDPDIALLNICMDFQHLLGPKMFLGDKIGEGVMR